MIRVFYKYPAIFIDNYRSPIPAGTLQAVANGTVIAIQNLYTAQSLVAADFTLIGDVNGNGFDTISDCVAYLNAQFVIKPDNVIQEILSIKEQNVIPPLSQPWTAAPFGFANIIAGADTFANGGGVATFSDGSTDVTFNPSAAGFNLNPGELVIAQYTSNQ